MAKYEELKSGWFIVFMDRGDMDVTWDQTLTELHPLTWLTQKQRVNKGVVIVFWSFVSCTEEEWKLWEKSL